MCSMAWKGSFFQKGSKVVVWIPISFFKARRLGRVKALNISDESNGTHSIFTSMSSVTVFGESHDLTRVSLVDRSGARSRQLVCRSHSAGAFLGGHDVHLSSQCHSYGSF